jgi:hypothetical protein
MSACSSMGNKFIITKTPCNENYFMYLLHSNARCIVLTCLSLMKDLNSPSLTICCNIATNCKTGAIARTLEDRLAAMGRRIRRGISGSPSAQKFKFLQSSRTLNNIHERFNKQGTTRPPSLLPATPCYVPPISTLSVEWESAQGVSFCYCPCLFRDSNPLGRSADLRFIRRCMITHANHRYAVPLFLCASLLFFA